MVSLITPWIARNEAATSILVYGEVIEHLKGQPDFTDRQQVLRILLQAVYPYFLTYPILEHYADIRRQMRRPYGLGLIGDVDTLIAATAIDRNLTVVTADRDFERVPHLNTLTVVLRK